jgi:3-hydroxybenzoate 6-monooxygenase
MEAIGFRPGAIRLLDSLTDQELSRQTLGRAFEVRFEYPYRVAFRADVQRVLLQASLALPDLIEITLGDGFTSFEQDPDGVAVLLDSGATVQRSGAQRGAAARFGLHRLSRCASGRRNTRTPGNR